ncbi:MAG: Ribosome maturation factor RimM [Bacteroidia bacterium]|nr:Ribosome maturation factor RimM [Bacteroidia bacterium]
MFVDISPTPVPFFIEALLNQSNDLITVKLEYINSSEQAAQYCGLNVLTEHKKTTRSNQFQPDDVIGFRVVDTEHGDIGTISGLLEMPQQVLFQIDNMGKEILIPANEQFIKKIDRKNKKMEIEAPEGLINLYLE